MTDTLRHTLNRKALGHLENIMGLAHDADQRYLDTGDRSALDAAIEYWDHILGNRSFSVTPEGFQLAVLNNAAVTLMRRYQAQDRLDDLSQALTLWQRAVGFTPPDSPHLPVRLSNLGGGLRARYNRTGRMEDLEQAIETHQQAVGLTPPDSPNLPIFLSNLGNGLSDLYEHTGRMEDLEGAIQAYQRAVELTPPDSPLLPAILHNLGNQTRERYEHTGRMEDLEGAIQAFHQAVQLSLPDSPQLPAILTNLGAGLHDRYQHAGRMEDLEGAIQAYQQAAQVMPPDWPNLPRYLNNLGNSLSDCYYRTGRMEDLEQAIQAYQQAVELATQDSPHLPAYLSSLGNGLGARYQHIGAVEDLEQAIQAYQQAVQLTPQDSPQLPIVLNSLGTGLRDRYRRTGKIEDLQLAIQALQRAIQLTPPSSPKLPVYLNNLGIGLSDLYEHTGRMEDLEGAIEAYQRAVELTPPDSPHLPVRLSNLGGGLLDRYNRTGRMEDLEQAIQTFQQAVRFATQDSPHLPAYLSSLGNGLGARHQRTGSMEDLEQAVEAFQQAVRLTPQDSPHLPVVLRILGNGLYNRYQRTGRMEDLEQAILRHQHAVQLTPPDSPDLHRNLNSLGAGLRDRYRRTRQMEDLDGAIEALRQAEELMPPDSPYLPLCLSNLGGGLLDRYELTGGMKDLEQAIQTLQQAVELTSSDSPYLSLCLSNLGGGLLDRYNRTGRMEDLEQAVELYRTACRRGLEAASEMALWAAGNWGNWATERKQWPEAAEAYQYGTQALEQLYRTQLLRASKETWLAQAQELHTLAAYALAKTGDLEGAVVTLEHGRARLLSEVLERDRADLQRAQQEDLDAFALYQSAAVRLRHLEMQDPASALMGEHQPPFTPDDLRRQIRQARNDLDAAIERIRRIPDYKDFLAQSDFHDLANAAQPDTPIVYLATTPVGSLALIVPLRAKGLSVAHAVWLDDFGQDDLDSLLMARDPDENVVGGYLVEQVRGDIPLLQAALDQALPILRDRLMGPLTTRLVDLGFQQATLIPGGRLSLLPLHAALPEVTAFTYAPSARTLHTARNTARERTDLPLALLAVGNPLPNLHPLPFARTEVESIEALFPRGARRVFYEYQATRYAVVKALPNATHLHFSCHGTFHVKEPLKSTLFLSGEDKLTLWDLLDGDLDLSTVRLAVLSACQTGITDFVNLPDEAIGLPAAFLQAGVPTVVSTLWPVADISTALLVTRFYRYHLEDGLDLAMALCRAQTWLRQEVGRSLVIDSINSLLTDLEGKRRQVKRWSEEEWSIDQQMRRLQAQRSYLLNEEKRDPGGRPFHHPYYWAAFSVSGADYNPMEVNA